MDHAVLNLVSDTDFTAVQVRPAVLKDYRRLGFLRLTIPEIRLPPAVKYLV